jgi:hypothetical protein
MEDNSVVITILSAMITPAILILACGSLSLTTSQRLSRTISRTRKISDEINEIRQGVKTVPEGFRFLLYRQLLNATERSVLLQRVMTLLYVAISFFIATSLLIGVFDILTWERSWVLIGLTMIGSIALLAASVILIMETRLALVDVDNEMKFIKISAVRFNQEGSNI